MPPGVCTDPAETAGVAAKLRQSACQAALPQRTVLRAVVAIRSPGDVSRRSFRASRRCRRIVFSSLRSPATYSCTYRSIAPGRGEIPDQSPLPSEPPASERTPGRWPDRQSSTCAPGTLRGKEHCAIIAVIGVAIGRAPVEYARSDVVQLSAPRPGEKFLVRIFVRTL
jgi:hypothetical protein